LLRDARDLDDGSAIEADLCIVGAGAAGITIARAFAGRGVKVVLLEAGGLEYSDDCQALYQGRNVGHPYYALDECRLRFFGGTTNHWGGRCRPLDPIDFQRRPWLPLSGWPVSQAELARYLDEAQRLCQLGPPDYTPAGWLGPNQAALPFDPLRLISRSWQYSPPTVFGEVYRPELEQAGNIEIIVNANVVEIVTTENGARVEALRLATLAGRRLTARSRRYVLACGGLETPRLLLASNRQVNVGVGNQHDLVGRYFGEHLSLAGGRAWFEDPAAVAFYTEGAGNTIGGVNAVGCLNLSPELQAERQILNFDAMFLVDTSVDDTGYAALSRIWHAARAGELPDDLLADLRLAIGDLDDALTRFAGRFGLADYVPKNGRFLVWCSSEQEPNPDSRVTLDDALDPLGMPRLRLDWRLTELDRRTLVEGFRAVAQEIGRAGLGRMQLAEEFRDPDSTAWPGDLEGGRHHMGTTRMSDDPKRGVVDAQCRVHGVDNLYIAGSSVFPTGGSANATLTIVALALRLAESLSQDLEAS
jgi:choline dehydrogenase-like flavoprotein